MDDEAKAVIERAIYEVLNAYEEAGWTYDGLLDVGPCLLALGELIGMDVRQTVREGKQHG